MSPMSEMERRRRWQLVLTMETFLDAGSELGIEMDVLAELMLASPGVLDGPDPLNTVQRILSMGYTDNRKGRDEC